MVVTGTAWPKKLKILLEFYIKHFSALCYAISLNIKIILKTQIKYLI